MATTKDATRTRVDNIKTQLRSILTCTSATVAELQRLLLGKLEGHAEKENLQVKSAPAPARRRAASRPTATTDVTKRTVVIIAPRDKYVLATEVANTTLKLLADALKSQPSPQPTSKSTATPTQAACKPPNQRNTHNKSTSISQRPLQERPASQMNNSPRKPSSKRRSASCSSFLVSGPDPGLVATAECARIAFAYLGTPEAFKTLGKDSQELQLENGILALIGKLVAHGLDNLAIKELRVLKKRLSKFLETETPDPGFQLANGKLESKKSVSNEKETLASLLDFGNLPRTSPAVPIAASLQTYVLRIVSRLGRPRVVEACWDHLKISNPSSPANLTWYTAKNPSSQAKTARQLESLAQTILLLCPSISSSEDNNHQQPSPEIAFSLQHLALTIRRRWWKLAKHQGNEEKEILEPFSKCLVAFSRRSKLSPAKTYKLAEYLYTDLLGSGAESGSPTNGSQSGSTTAKALGTLAQSAGLVDEALRWLGASSPSPDASAARQAARIVRLATVSIESSLKGGSVEGLEEIIASALERLAGSLSGSASELDSLFMEANALRRIATRALSAPKPPKAEECDISSLQQQALRMIAASVRFCARFVGTELAGSNSMAQSRHKERILMTSKFFKSMLDSALASCKQSKIPDTEWNQLDSVIQDCVYILQRFEEHCEDDKATGQITTEDMRSYFVKISNAYWALHLQLRKASGTPDQILMAMQRSTELLQQRPEPERESGLLAMKLERLAEALDHLDRTEDCRSAFAHCIQALTNREGQQELNRQAAEHPLRQIFESDGPTGSLGRVLKSYHRTFTRPDSSNTTELAFFDDPGLADSPRGALLEWQLSLYLKTLSRNRPWDANLNASIQTIAKLVLHLYSPAQFPIRRQRLCVMLLHIAQSYPGILSEQLLQACSELPHDFILKNTEDHGLGRFGNHSRALLTLKCSLQESTPSSAAVHNSFSIWESLLNSSKSWADLSACVDDVEYWLQEMQAAADYLAAKGEEYKSIPVLHLIVRVLELERRTDPSDLILNLCALGLQFLRLGYSGKAGLAFAKAETLIAHDCASTESKLRWNLSYAEYLLCIGNGAKCERTLLAAKTIAMGDASFMSLSKPSTTLLSRMRYNRVLADSCYVHSLLCTSTGAHKDAARFAKQSVVLNRRIWAAFESKTIHWKATSNDSTDNDSGGLTKSSFDPLSSVRNEKGIPLVMSITHDSLSGPDFWSLVPSLYRALMQHSKVFSHLGLLHEAVYVAEQAEKVALATHSRSFIIDNASHRADYWTQSSRPDKAQAILESFNQPGPPRNLFTVRYYSSMARLYHANGELDEEMATFDSMESLLKELTTPSHIRHLDTFSSEIDEIAESMSAVKLEDSGVGAEKVIKATRGRGRKPAVKAIPKAVPKPTPVPRSRIARKAAPKAASKASQKAPQPLPHQTLSIAEECLSLSSLQGDIISRRVMCNLLQENISKAVELVKEARVAFKDFDKNAMYLWATFKTTLAQSLKHLAQDFALNTLPESTIAFPAIAPTARKSSDGMTAKPKIAGALKLSRNKKHSKENFAESLQEARNSLAQAHELCVSTRSTHTFQQVSSALSHVTILLSAVLGGETQGMSHPLHVAYLSEIPRRNMLMLARDSIEVEQEIMSKEECLKWPGSELVRQPLGSATDFQKDYIDVIPKSWIAVSLAMSEERDELYITRYESGTSPFVLRLPIARHTSRDMDEEEFTFEDGKRDFDEIIELSDFSTRSAKDMTTREARLQWWAEREALDSRLRELLLNIENIWLGGFKGIFSQQTRQLALLARFRKSFENILNRHLPSRKKKYQQKSLNLDPRILELFIGLGDASNGEVDLDEPLMDLIYFVVDILQFNGEHNAYDEIDFDAMMVDTLDALHAYHASAQSTETSTTHTILILDKYLHGFPWESMPCLEKLSISRLPSLAALRERILSARLPNDVEDPQPGHYISTATGGTSILNPSGDLSHTSKTIKPRLDEMQGSWTHIANRAPTENEFEDSLKDKELVLYFGHGSGAQFVRSKSVRNLYPGEQPEHGRKPGCATTFLFGCSSAHLSENGIYEPSGMLASYLTAGAPAVVGMLWDVTDKDCDRFAVKAGELWGLWPESNVDVEASKTGKTAKGKGKTAQVVEETESARGTTRGKRGRKDRAQLEDMGQGESTSKVRHRRVGLDEAVRAARDVCVLRYLNGAAAVMYGIPVYLE